MRGIRSLIYLIQHGEYGTIMGCIAVIILVVVVSRWADARRELHQEPEEPQKPPLDPMEAMSRRIQALSRKKKTQAPKDPAQRSTPSAGPPPLFAQHTDPEPQGPRSKVLVGVGLIVLLLGGVGGLVLASGSSATTLHVLAVGDRGIELVVDGQSLRPVQREGRHFQFSLDRGPHEVSLKDPTLDAPHRLTVDLSSAGSEIILPVYADLCLTRFEVSQLLYGTAALEYGQLPPKLQLHVKLLSAGVEHHGNPSELVPVPGSTYFQLSTLPAHIERNEKVFLMAQIPCQYARKPSTAFIAAGLLLPGLSSKLGVTIADLELASLEGEARAPAAP